MVVWGGWAHSCDVCDVLHSWSWKKSPLPSASGARAGVRIQVKIPKRIQIGKCRSQLKFLHWSLLDDVQDVTRLRELGIGFVLN